MLEVSSSVFDQKFLVFGVSSSVFGVSFWVFDQKFMVFGVLSSVFRVLRSVFRGLTELGIRN